eukprot:scaffold4973_cov135-Cylindrotheca_fusiformis.AAC.14
MKEIFACCEDCGRLFNRHSLTWPLCAPCNPILFFIWPLRAPCNHTLCSLCKCVVASNELLHRISIHDGRPFSSKLLSEEPVEVRDNNTA